MTPTGWPPVPAIDGYLGARRLTMMNGTKLPPLESVLFLIRHLQLKASRKGARTRA
jgi:hypothetical protein